MKYFITFDSFLNESKRTESDAIRILNKFGIDDINIINDFKDIDNTKNQILLPAIAFYYTQKITLNDLNQVFSKIPILIQNNLVKQIQVTKKGVMLNNQLVKDWLEFSEAIDGAHGRYEYDKHDKDRKDKDTKLQKLENDDEPIWSGNNIEIYSGSDVGKCIRLGRGKSFCISQPGNTMYQSYRDGHGATFYFIYDQNQKDNPLNIVVYDVGTNNNILLTDERNTTGDIHKYGKDVSGYQNYLKDMGVPIDDIFHNKPQTEEEKKEFNIIGKYNGDLNWFVNLSPEYKSKYIGIGHELSDEQFDYIFNNNINGLINQYINSGISLPKEQVDKLKSNKAYYKSYIRTQAIQFKNDLNGAIKNKNLDIVNYLINNDAKVNNDTLYHSISYFPNNYELLNKLIKKGAKPNNSALDYAIETKNMDIFNLIYNMIDKNEFEISLFTLGKAVKHGNIEVINKIVDLGGEFTPFDQDILNTAIDRRDNDIIKKTIELGAKPNRHTIIKPIKDNNDEIVKLLIYEFGNPTSDTLNVAIEERDYELIDKLFKLNVDHNIKNSIEIMKTRNLNVIKKYLEKDVEVNSVILNFAIVYNDTDLVKRVIELGADIGHNTFKLVRKSSQEIKEIISKLSGVSILDFSYYV